MIRYVVLVSLLFCSNLLATNYYVATTGNDSNPGTEGSPWLTLQKAANTVGAGDTVFVKVGVYGGFHMENVSGGSGNEIVFIEFGSDSVTIDGFSNSYANSQSGAAFINCDYIQLIGFTIHDSNPAYDSETFSQYSQGVNRYGVQTGTGSTHITIKNCHIYRIGHDAILTSNTGSFTTVENNLIHDVGLSKRGYGVYVAGDDEVVRGNTIYNAYGYGIHNFGTPAPNRGLIEDNRVYDVGSLDYGKGHSGWPAAGIKTGDGIIVSNHGVDAIVRNNFVDGTEGWGIRVQNTDAVVYNNTVRDAGRQGIYIYAGKNTTVRNNISYLSGGEDGYPGEYFIGSGNTSSNNLFGVNPLFASTDPTNSEHLKLSTGSAAIDGGTTVSGFTDDFFGSIRPEGLAWDIGAHEFAGGAPPAGGTTYRVHPSGSNTAPYDTWAKARTTIQGSIDNLALTGGDVVEISGGAAGDSIVYAENITLTGSDDGVSDNSRVIFRASTEVGHNGKVVIRPSSGARCLDMQGTSFVTWTGISKYRLVFDADNVTAESVKLYGTGGDENIWRYAEFRNMNDGRASASASHGISIDPTDELDSDGNIFQYCLITDTGAEGSTSWQGFFDSAVRTTLDNVVFQRPWGGHGYQATDGSANNIQSIIKNCRFNGSSPATDKSGVNSAIQFRSGGGHKAYNNQVWGWKEGTDSDGISVWESDTCDVFNNTVWDNSQGIEVVTAGTDNTELTNNIVFNNTADITDNGTGTTQTTNSTTDPSFVSTVDADADFLKISSASNAYNAGTTLTLFNTDIFGTTRPQVDTWDIGAHEFFPEVTAGGIRILLLGRRR